MVNTMLPCNGQATVGETTVKDTLDRAGIRPCARPLTAKVRQPTRTECQSQSIESAKGHSSTTTSSTTSSSTGSWTYYLLLLVVLVVLVELLVLLVVVLVVVLWL